MNARHKFSSGRCLDVLAGVHGRVASARRDALDNSPGASNSLSALSHSFDASWLASGQRPEGLRQMSASTDVGTRRQPQAEALVPRCKALAEAGKMVICVSDAGISGMQNRGRVWETPGVISGSLQKRAIPKI